MTRLELGGADLDLHHVRLQELRGQRPHGAGPRGAEHERLAVLPGHAEQLLDVRLEPHVAGAPGTTGTGREDTFI